MRFLLLIFIAIPIIEMVVLIKVGGLIGVFPTVALVVLTAMAGVWLLKREGSSTLTRLQEKLAEGELPGKELLEGVMLIIGGALLLTPGFVTDAIGFVCLIPWLRQPLATWLLNHTRVLEGAMSIRSVHSGTVFKGTTHTGSGHSSFVKMEGGRMDRFHPDASQGDTGDPRIINGEFEREEDKKPD